MWNSKCYIQDISPGADVFLFLYYGIVDWFLPWIKFFFRIILMFTIFFMCLTQEYLYHTMSLSQYHGCCQYHKSMSIPWVYANTMSPCLYHESKSKPWVHVYTMSPCRYNKSHSIPWVHVYTMSLCQIHASISIPWEKQFSDIQTYK